MHLASPFGIPVRLHWSFFVLVVGLLGWGAWMAGAAGALVVGIASMGLFGSVILHELGHAMAARQYGIGTEHITLYPFGGVAAIQRMPEEPDQEIVIALAGPAVNVVLAGLGGWIWMMTDQPLVLGFVMTNLGMAGFNMIPAFPMDGGRVLRAVLSRRMGFIPASKLSVKIGRMFAVVFIAAGVWFVFPSLVMVGVFLFVALRSEEEQLVARHWQETTGTPPPWQTPSPGATSLVWSPR
jgi:Zn-dependent protease